VAQQVAAERFEVVVADNNSACGIAAVQALVAASGLARARVVPAPEQGAGPARNAGVAASAGALLAFLDSDCAAAPGWLAAGMAGLDRWDFLGGQVVTVAADPAAPNPVEAFEVVFNFDFRRYVEEVGFTGTGNMFTTRAVFDRVGGFRAGVSEDMDWSFRARALGFRLGYVAEALVEHPARQSWAELLRRWDRILAEQYALARARPGGRLGWALRALARPLSVPPHAWRIWRAPRLPRGGRGGWQARRGGIGILLRLRLWRMRRMRRMLALALR
jgi:GT2 family glycosyltransferase